MALDIETKGSDASSALSCVVGLAIADERGSWYFPVSESNREQYARLLKILKDSNVEFLAHNLFFDGAFLYRDAGQTWLNWRYCTYALYKHLATEGFPGQEWGLKSAQKDLLGWKETNEEELDGWLIENGYSYNGQTDGVYGLKPKKEEMWRAPDHILGKYCGLDAWSTWAIYEYVFKPALEKFYALEVYEQQFLGLIKKLIEQQMTGTLIDIERLTTYHGQLMEEIEASKYAFLNHESVKPYVDERRNALLAVHAEKEPAQFKKRKPLGKEPAKFTKAGKLSKSWQTWEVRRIMLETTRPETSKNWLKWEEQRQAILNDDDVLNLNSGKQMQWLFYDKLNNEQLFTTKAGQPATDKKALLFFGEPGRLLKDYNDKVKEESYIQACFDKVDEANVIHPQYRTPGTLTGRLSGSGGLNCFHPDTEYLTKEKGWIPVAAIKEGMHVWQVFPASKLGSWTEVTADSIIERDYKGAMYAFGGQRGELIVTENHRMAWYGGSTQEFKYLETVEAKDLFPQSRRTILHATIGAIEEPGVVEYTEEEIWKALMLQADGSIRKDKKEGIYQLGLKKIRKRMKARELLKDCKSSLYNEVEYWSYVFFKSRLLCHKTKLLDLSSVSISMASVVLEAMAFWDGYKRQIKEGINIEYYSNEERNVDELMAYFCRAGYTTRKLQYGHKFRLTVTDNLHSDCRKDRHVRTFFYEGKVHCITVPSGHLLVRSNNRCFVTGNCQQLPKSKGYLSCWIPRPGHVFVDCDFTSMEQVVLAELSKDKALWNIYGPNAKPNDVYLFTGSSMPVIGEAIRAAGYDRNNPTVEGISAAKKKAKKERSIAKAATLGFSYGMGPGKLIQQLLTQSVHITKEQAYAIHEAYWNLYSGVKEYEKELKRQWRLNKGYVLNGIGRPMGIWEEREKDIVNRVVQSTAHDVLVLWVNIIERQLKEKGIPFSWAFVDFHDQSIIEVKEEHAESVASVMGGSAMDELNELIGGDIPLTGDAQIVRTLAEAKIED